MYERKPMSIPRPLALVTGASSGIGFELARCCAADGHDLVITADTDLAAATAALQALGAQVTALQVDLAKTEGVDELIEQLQDRPLQVLVANAGHGLGHAFLEQEFEALRHVVDTNITGTLYLLHRVVRSMQRRRNGRVLITGSIAGFMPGSYQAVYNASKAFIDSFAAALRDELQGSGVSLTCLMPGATDTAFFARADMEGTALGRGPKDSPAFVAQAGYDAMKAGAPGVVTGWKNKLQVAMAQVTPSPVAAAMHRRMAEPEAAPN